MAKLWTSDETGITYDVTRRDADGRFAVVSTGTEPLMMAAGIIAAGAVATTLATVYLASAVVLLTAGTVIAMSNWPLMPLFLMAGALVCLATTPVRRLAGTRRIVGMILACLVLFVATIASTVLAMRYQPYATFVHLPWVAVAATATAASPLGRRAGRVILACCASLAVTSLLFWLSGLASGQPVADQVLATASLAIIFTQILWWRAWSRIRRDQPPTSVATH